MGETTDGRDCGATKGERRAIRVAANKDQHLEIQCSNIVRTAGEEKA